MGALTYDDGKPPLARLPLKALREVAFVQLYGAQKYGDFENYRKGMEITRNASCAIRHIADFMDGQDLDSESGCNHLAHAACRLLFILENIAEGTAIDDRFKREPVLSHAMVPEDVCTGGRLTCTECGKLMPCLCGHRKESGGAGAGLQPK